ncbi:hypothetical protein BDZ89DRAFT_102731 [Hymenopellis radicata]|nr:hypothetical protein BDZ89DRAFT_102731 [Hymenopellis radicata]
MSRIPQELTDAILGHLIHLNGFHRKRTLSNCALVCRAWCHSSQRLLFQTFRTQICHDSRHSEWQERQDKLDAFLRSSPVLPHSYGILSLNRRRITTRRSTIFPIPWQGLSKFLLPTQT